MRHIRASHRKDVPDQTVCGEHPSKEDISWRNRAKIPDRSQVCERCLILMVKK